MCSALKTHAVQVEDAVCKGQCDREQLVEVDRERMTQFQVGRACVRLLGSQ